MIKFSKLNPLVEFHDILKSVLLEDPKNNSNITKDNVCKAILYNNGCKFTDNVEPLFQHIKLESIDNYYLTIAYNCNGNEVNDFYDYIEYYGNKYLVIFKTCFLGLINKVEDELFRYSQYVDIIIKLVDVFLNTTSSMAEISGALNTSAAANNYRYAPTIIACDIVDKLVGLTEKDVSNIKYEDIRDMLDHYSLNKLLIGIRN